MHHNHTPESVLNAPLPVVVHLVTNTGPNRFDRRHTQRVRGGAWAFIPKDYQQPAVNTPFVKPKKGTR